MIRRGQFLTSYDILKNDTGLSVQKIRTCLDHLTKSKEITRTSTSKHTIITLLNFNTYNIEESEINKQDNKPITNEQQTDNKQITTTKKEEKVKKEKKKEITADTLQYPVWFDSDLKLLFEDHLKIRVKLKAQNTDRAITGLLNSLEKMSNKDINNAKKLLENAVINSWKSYYPLKDNDTQQSGYQPIQKPDAEDIEMKRILSEKFGKVTKVV